MTLYRDDTGAELQVPPTVLGVTSGGAGADMSATSGFWMQASAGAPVTTSAITVFNVRHYGAVGDGTTDDTTAFEAAWNAAIAAGGRALIYMPTGVYLITRALPAFVGWPVRVCGDGVFATQITWSPSTGTNPALMTWQPAANLSTLNFVEADHFAIYTSNSYTKVGIRSIGTAYASSFHHLRIQLLHAGDTAHEIQGWDSTHISDVFYNATRPVYVKKLTAGASSGSGAFDHFTFTNCFFQSYDDAQPLIDFETGVTISRLTFNGDQTWVGGSDGCKFVSTGTMRDASFSNVRWENSASQIATPSLHGYMFDLEPAAASGEVVFINCRGGSQGSQGWKLRNLSRISLIATNFEGSWSASFNQLDIDSSNDNLLFLNAVFSNAANAVRTINAALVQSVGGPVHYVGGLTPFAYWQKSAGTVALGSGAVATSLKVNGATTESLSTADEVRIGVVSGTPRVMFEDAASTTLWQLDNSAGSFRIFNPGANKFTLETNRATFDVIPRFSASEKRVSTQFDKTSDTTLANVTGLSVDVVASRTYAFEANLVTTSNASGGVKFAIAGTATATAIVYESVLYSAGVSVAVGTARATALATAVGDLTAVTATRCLIRGTITVNAGGTLTAQFAQNASFGTASSVLVGSTFRVTEVA